MTDRIYSKADNWIFWTARVATIAVCLWWNTQPSCLFAGYLIGASLWGRR